MQELISKEAVLKLARQLETHLVWYTPTELEPKEFIKKIDSLPTTVHHEYKVGNLKLIEAEEAIKLLVEYSDKLPQWLLEKMSNLPIYENEYKVGDEVEVRNFMSNKWGYVGIIKSIRYDVLLSTWQRLEWCDTDEIRPLKSEHPDITQARELASRHWLKLTKI